MSENLALQTRGLVKKFGTFAALNGLDLQVAAGEVHGFLGPNGAGKSTTIRVLLGLLRPTAGSAHLLGGDPWRDVVELHARLAYVPGDVALWPNLSGGEAIDLLGNLRGGLNETKRAELIERFELDPTKRGRQYSKGNRQKVAIIAALASDVELLILDEPTSGLDPLMEAVFQDEIRKVKREGRTVLLSSHIMSEVEALADSISIIRDGKIVQTGTIAQLRGDSHVNIQARLAQPHAQLLDLPVFAAAQLSAEGHFAAKVAPDHIGEALAALTKSEVLEIEVNPASLEELFMRHYDSTANAEAAS